MKRWYGKKELRSGDGYLPATEGMAYDLDNGMVAYGYYAASQYLDQGGMWAVERRSGRRLCRT
jgi:hypothetical protein